jgi:hypothetical protein
VKRIVTTFRSSRAGAAADASAAPHIPQRRKPSGFSWPQAGHVTMSLTVNRSVEAVEDRLRQEAEPDVAFERLAPAGIGVGDRF